jgi:hypothetical protein
MIRGGYGARKCQACKRGLHPRFPNQRVHPECQRLWKRRYQKLYQRRVRKELKEDWDVEAAR